MKLQHKHLSLALVFLFISVPVVSQITIGNQVPQSTPIITAVPFLLINGNPQSAGMGDIGAVASPVYYDSDLNQNPALLARNINTIGFQLNYSPWLRALGISDIHLINVGGHITFASKHVLSYRSRIFDLGEIAYTDPFGQQLLSNPQEQSHGLGYATSVNENFSLGIRLNYIFSNLPFNGVEGKPVHSFAGDLGLLYQNTMALDSRTKWVWSTGLSIKNMGPKISYSTNAAAKGFIPTNLEFGGMLGLYNSYDEETEFVIEGAYQFSKLLVPSEGVFSDKSALAGMFTSWGDANDVGKQESQEFIHQLGIEGRLQLGSSFMAAVRGGVFLEHQVAGGRRFATFGASFGAAGLRLDISYLRPFQQNHPLQNTLRFGLTFLVDQNQEDFGLIKF